MKKSKTDWLYSEVEDQPGHRGNFFKGLFIALVLSLTIITLCFTCAAEDRQKESLQTKINK
jgi:hypothetical protein